jgi:hypothetical protein
VKKARAVAAEANRLAKVAVIKDRKRAAEKEALTRSVVLKVTR